MVPVPGQSTDPALPGWELLVMHSSSAASAALSQYVVGLAVSRHLCHALVGIEVCQSAMLQHTRYSLASTTEPTMAWAALLNSTCSC